MAKKITAEFELDRETKNTYKYAEVDTEVFKSLYVRKDALGKTAPKKITVVVTSG